MQTLRDAECEVRDAGCLASQRRRSHIAFLKKRTHLFPDFTALTQKNEPILSHLKAISNPCSEFRVPSSGFRVLKRLLLTAALIALASAPASARAQSNISVRVVAANLSSGNLQRYE